MIKAEWVVRSREPGGRQGDHIVAFSEGSLGMDSHSEALVTEWLPGTVKPTDQTGSAALPWIWFAPAEQHLGMATVTEGSADRDVNGLRINPTTYLRVPLDEIAKARTSYRALADELDAAARDYAGEHVVRGRHARRRLRLPPLNPSEQEAAINQFGFHVVAGIAALVLDGRPVGLCSARRMSSEERLTLLDAIAALLPYEWRLRLVASTWAEPKARHHLYFTGSPCRGHAFVRLDGGVPPSPNSYAAIQYLTLLAGDGLRKRHSLDSIVAHLAAVDRPSDELAVLSRLDRPHALWRLVQKRNDVPLDEVRALLAEKSDPAGLPTSELADLVAFLVRVGDPHDAEIIVRRLTDVAPLADVVRAALGRGAALDVGWLVDVADTLHLREALLVRLVGPPDPSTAKPIVRGRSLTRRRAKDPEAEGRVLAGVADWLRPGDDGWPTLRTILLANPALTYRLVANQVSGRRGLPRARDTLTWLTAGAPAPPGPLRVLDLLLRGQQPSLAEVAVLAPAVTEQDVDVVRAAVALADRLHRAWERRIGGGPVADTAAAHDEWAELGLLAETRTTPSEQVQLDLLGYLIDCRPVAPLDQRLVGDTGAAYIVEFARRFWSRRLTDDDRWLVTMHLAAHVRGLPDWTGGTAASGILNLFGHLIAGLAEHRASTWRPHHLLDVVERGRAASAELADLPAYQAFIEGDRARPLDDPLAELHMLRRVRDDLDVTVLAARSARLLERGGKALAGELLNALDGSRHLTTGQGVNDFLVLVWRALPERARHEQVAVYWELVEAAHGEYLGADVVGRLAEFERVTGVSEIRRWFRQLRLAGMPVWLLRELLQELLHELPDDLQEEDPPDDNPQDGPDTHKGQ